MHHRTAKNTPPHHFFFFLFVRRPFYVIISLFPLIVWACFIVFEIKTLRPVLNYCRVVWTFLMLPCVQLNQCLLSVQPPKPAVLFYSLPFLIICPGAGNIQSSVTLLPFSFPLHVYYSICFEIFVLDDRGSKKSQRKMRDLQLQPGC